MNIKVKYQNKLEREALTYLLRDKGLNAQNYSSDINGFRKMNFSDLEVYLMDVTALKSQHFNDLAYVSEYRNSRSLLIGDIGQMHHFFSYTGNLHGFLSNNNSIDELINGIKCLPDNDHYLCNRSKKFLSKDRLSRQRFLLNNELEKPLSPTELIVINKVGDGLTTKQIATEMYRSVHTINNHRKNAMNKLRIKGTFSLGIFSATYLDEIRTLRIISENEQLLQQILNQ